MPGLAYAGSELRIFEQARHWKSYWRSRIEPFVRGDVLEVGAGIGANTALFADTAFHHWTCVEPDDALASQIALPSCERHAVLVGTITDLPARARFDTILYADVLEHIEDDEAEVKEAASRLRGGGVLIVLAPAYPFLYTPFDGAIGHFRRYTRNSLRRLAPPHLAPVRLEYLDSAGMLASLGNRLLLRRATPSSGQIRTWDTVLVPISRWTDRLLLRRMGKSILGIWLRAR